MGVNPTPTNFKTFTFNGENSRDYGVYITGEGVFNAPERNIEMVEIPGRNGSYALDKGNFNNIEVTYPAGIFADTETDFAEAVSELRNFLCSQKGYVRLEDDYNQDEYRLAIYKSGLDVSHDMLIAGEFDITFDCQPQRYLKSGESAVSVTSGDTITNPTRFEAKPQLQVVGYGDIDIGGKEIAVENIPVGEIFLSGGGLTDLYGYFSLDLSPLNVGDSFYVDASEKIRIDTSSTATTISSFSITNATGCSYDNVQIASNNMSVSFRAILEDKTLAKDASGSQTGTITATIVIINGGTTYTHTVTIQPILNYDGVDKLQMTNTASFSPTTSRLNWSEGGRRIGQVFGFCTKSTIGNPMYIDLDIGEAWNEDSGSPVSTNNAVTLPPELPTLQSGNTTITYDNTFTSFKVVPRWWKV